MTMVILALAWCTTTHPSKRIIWTKDGMAYPCQYGVMQDGYGYRCAFESSSIVLPASSVSRIE